jgi:hypothetical protein
MAIAKRYILVCGAILFAIFCSTAGPACAQEFIFKVTYEGTADYTANLTQSDAECGLLASYDVQGTISWKIIWNRVNLIPSDYTLVFADTVEVSGSFGQTGLCFTGCPDQPPPFKCNGNFDGDMNREGSIIIVTPNSQLIKNSIEVSGPWQPGISSNCDSSCSYAFYSGSGYVNLLAEGFDPNKTNPTEPNALYHYILLSWPDIQTNDKIIKTFNGSTTLLNPYKNNSDMTYSAQLPYWSGQVTFEKISKTLTTTTAIESSSTTSSTTTPPPDNTTSIQTTSTPPITIPPGSTTIPPGSTTTTVQSTTTTTTGSGCPSDYPVDCDSQGMGTGCCPTDYPICGSDGYCHKEGSNSTTTVCMFAQSLDNAQQIEAIRKMRDSLITNTYGGQLTALYYQHAEELQGILEQNPELKKRFIALVAENLAVARQLTASRQAKIPAAKMQKIIYFLKNLKAQGSEKLQADIEMVLKGLEDKSLLNNLGVFVE